MSIIDDWTVQTGNVTFQEAYSFIDAHHRSRGCISSAHVHASCTLLRTRCERIDSRGGIIYIFSGIKTLCSGANDTAVRARYNDTSTLSSEPKSREKRLRKHLSEDPVPCSSH